MHETPTDSDASLLAPIPPPAPAPQRRPTRRQCVELCRKLLTMRVHDTDIELSLAESYGTTGRSARRYLARAKRALLDAARRPRDEHVADAYALYCAVISDPNAKHADKLKAQERIDKLLGLNAPQDGDGPAADRKSDLPSWLITSIECAGPLPTAEPTNVVDGAEEYERLMAEREALGEDAQRRKLSADVR